MYGSVVLFESMGAAGVRMSFIVVIGLLLGMLLGVALYDRFSKLPDIAELSEPQSNNVADAEIQSIVSLDRFLALTQSMADMQFLHQTQSLQLQQLDARLRLLEAAQRTSSTEQESLVQTADGGLPSLPSVLDQEGTDVELDSLSDTGGVARETETGWFVHVGMRAIEREAEALALALTESRGLIPTVIRNSEGAFWVRICRLPTQVRAQEVVQLLRRSSDDEALWIGRGCGLNHALENR